MVWIGTIINGVLLGGLYGLFGVGLALVFGVTRIVNIMQANSSHFPLSSLWAFPYCFPMRTRFSSFFP